MHTNLFRTLTAAALAVAATVSVVCAPAQAAGPRPLFQLPFPCGESWHLATYYGHDDYDIDMTANTGVTNGRPILASFAGTVVTAGWDSGGGWMVKLNHGNGWQSLYLHMIEAPLVSVNQAVHTGQQLGRVGSTGDSSGPHLHYEQRADGAKVESWFNGVPSGITSDGSPTTGPLFIGGPVSPSVNVVSRNCGTNDFDSDGKADLIYRRASDHNLYLIRGNGAGGWATGVSQQIGTGWQDADLLTWPGDFSGDAKPDLIYRRPSDHNLYLIRGNGAGGWASGASELIGVGWHDLDLLLAVRDFSGDGNPDVLYRRVTDQNLYMVRGNGSGGWVSGASEQIGTGWHDIDLLYSPGDFSGDGKVDLLLRRPSDHNLYLIRGNGSGGWATGASELIGTGWHDLDAAAGASPN